MSQVDNRVVGGVFNGLYTSFMVESVGGDVKWNWGFG